MMFKVNICHKIGRYKGSDLGPALSTLGHWWTKLQKGRLGN